MYIYVRKLSSGLLLQQRNEGRRRTIALALWFQADLVHTVGWVMILITPLKPVEVLSKPQIWSFSICIRQCEFWSQTWQPAVSVYYQMLQVVG